MFTCSRILLLSQNCCKSEDSTKCTTNALLLNAPLRIFCLCHLHTVGLAQDMSWAIMFLHPPMTIRYPVNALKIKKIIMELAEHECMLEVTFGDCSKDCHTVYKNGMQEWSWGQRGSHIKGSGRRTARLEFGLGGCYPLWIGSIVRFKENFTCGAKWNKVSGQFHALGKQCGVYLVYQL